MSDDLANLDAEMSALGGALLSPVALDDVATAMRSDDFHLPKHSVILEALLRLQASQLPTDVVAVADELIGRGELSQAGGADYLHHLTSVVPTAANAGYYAQIVHELAVKRRIVLASRRTISNAPTMEVGELMDLARRDIDAADTIESRDVAFVGDILDDVLRGDGGPRVTYETPWTVLNTVLGGGLRPGALYVLAARPSVGKSAIATQIAASLANRGIVGFSSLEMPKGEVVQRVIAQGANVPHNLIEQGRLSDFQRKRIDEWRPFAPTSISIDDRSTVTISDIRAYGRELKKSGPLVALVIDYLQLISGPSGQSRQEIVSEVTRQLKIMARDLDCAILALSQLNRGPEQRVDKRPVLSDLRESGSIEQDADVVMFIYRDPSLEAPDFNQPANALPIEIMVAKNRHGPTMNVPLLWEGMFMKTFDSHMTREFS